MKNNIKPFCVDTIVENLTDEQIKQLYDWCIEAGAGVYEDLNTWIRDKSKYHLMGIDDDNETRCLKFESCFEDVVLSFSEVQEHLGLLPTENNEEPLSEELTPSPCDCINEEESLSEAVTEGNKSITNETLLLSEDVSEAIKEFGMEMTTSVGLNDEIWHKITVQGKGVFRVETLEEFNLLVDGLKILKKYKF